MAIGVFTLLIYRNTTHPVYIHFIYSVRHHYESESDSDDGWGRGGDGTHGATWFPIWCIPSDGQRGAFMRGEAGRYYFRGMMENNCERGARTGRQSFVLHFSTILAYSLLFLALRLFSCRKHHRKMSLLRLVLFTRLRSAFYTTGAFFSLFSFDMNYDLEGLRRGALAVFYEGG